MIYSFFVSASYTIGVYNMFTICIDIGVNVDIDIDVCFFLLYSCFTTVYLSP